MNCAVGLLSALAEANPSFERLSEKAHLRKEVVTGPDLQRIHLFRSYPEIPLELLSAAGGNFRRLAVKIKD
jgi:hypothetical protein